ncbi:MAG: hypothetical protein ACOCZ8_07175 [Bacteroidota bacterium]
MRTSNYFRLLLAGLSALLFCASSCKKEKDDEPKPDPCEEELAFEAGYGDCMIDSLIIGVWGAQFRVTEGLNKYERFEWWIGTEEEPRIGDTINLGLAYLGPLRIALVGIPDTAVCPDAKPDTLISDYRVVEFGDSADIGKPNVLNEEEYYPFFGKWEGTVEPTGEAATIRIYQDYVQSASGAHAIVGFPVTPEVVYGVENICKDAFYLRAHFSTGAVPDTLLVDANDYTPDTLASYGQVSPDGTQLRIRYRIRRFGSDLGSFLEERTFTGFKVE